MAGQLVQVATETVSTASPTNSVVLTGINTDDVYMVTVSFQRFNTSNNVLRYR